MAATSRAVGGLGSAGKEGHLAEQPSGGPSAKPGKFPVGAAVGGIATVATLGVAISQLVLNGIEIKDKALIPVDKGSALERVDAPSPDIASAEDPPGLGRLRAADPNAVVGNELTLPTAAGVPYGQAFRYPAQAQEVALPPAVETQLHDLFVMLERSLRNREQFEYRVVFLDPRQVRLLRRPTEQGTRVDLGFQSAGVDATPELIIGDELWTDLQKNDYAALAVVVLTRAGESEDPPDIAWRGFNNELKESKIVARVAPLGMGPWLNATDAGQTVTLASQALVITFPEAPPS